MAVDTHLALPPIDCSATEIRVLDFSRTSFPRFEGSTISCTMRCVSLRETTLKYTIISHTPSPAEELVDCLVVDGHPVRTPSGLVSGLKTLSEQRIFLSMSIPVMLWIEELCVDHESAEETEYLQSIIPDIYKKAAGLMCCLGSGDLGIRTFLKATQLISRDVNRAECGTRDLLSWKSIFTNLRRRNRTQVGMPKTLQEYSGLTSHFFQHPFWNRMKSLQEYLSVKSLVLVYEDVVLWDSSLLEVGMMVLQQEDSFLPRETIPPAGIVNGPARTALQAGMQTWRRFVLWELARSFLRLHAERDVPLVWHYLAQLAPQLRGENDPDEENEYFHLACSMLQNGHSWPTPLRYVGKEDRGQGKVPLQLRGVLRWLMQVNKLSASETTGLALRPSAAMKDMLTVSRSYMSESPLFFLTHAGMGFYDRTADDVPSWIPDYDAISRSPARVPLTFEDPKTYSGYEYLRHNPTIQQGSLVIHGSRVGQLAEVMDIPEPKHIMNLFAFLRTLPTYEITSVHHRAGALRLVEEILLALHQDPHAAPTGAALHRCVGTLLLTAQSSPNPLFRLLDLSPQDDMTIVADRVRDAFLPGVGGGATDAYGWAEASRTAAVCLAEERIVDVRRYYGVGRVESGPWGLVPRGARVGDAVFKVRGYGAGVVLRSGEAGMRLVGACGIDVEEFDVWRGDWERIMIR